MNANALMLPDALLRHVIGLDQFSRFAQAAQGTPNYPPHNIGQTGEDSYRLELAVAGFAKDEIDITLHNGVLTVSGAKRQAGDAENAYDPNFGNFLYRGISFSDFDRQFTLAEHIRVDGISLENGLLVISLERQVPEEAKPKRLAIS